MHQILFRLELRTKPRWGAYSRWRKEGKKGGDGRDRGEGKWREKMYSATISVGIDLKELGGQLPKCLKFCPGIEV